MMHFDDPIDDTDGRNKPGSRDERFREFCQQNSGA